jgi:hypothetical protein
MALRAASKLVEVIAGQGFQEIRWHHQPISAAARYSKSFSLSQLFLANAFSGDRL